MQTDLFQSYGRCWVFQICWHIEFIIFIASSFRRGFSNRRWSKWKHNNMMPFEQDNRRLVPQKVAIAKDASLVLSIFPRWNGNSRWLPVPALFSVLCSGLTSSPLSPRSARRLLSIILIRSHLTGRAQKNWLGAMAGCVGFPAYPRTSQVIFFPLSITQSFSSHHKPKGMSRTPMIGGTKRLEINGHAVWLRKKYFYFSVYPFPMIFKSLVVVV